MENQQIKDTERVNWVKEGEAYIAATVNFPITIQAMSLDEMKRQTEEILRYHLEQSLKSLNEHGLDFKEFETGAEWLNSLHPPCAKCSTQNAV
jgi:uncharacterized protein (UPF0212 family)